MDAPYEIIEQLEPRIARVLAHNPSAFTYYGTQTYIVGDSRLAIIDPGPDDPQHVDALVDAIGDREVVAIVCTHTHRDHSPAAAALGERIAAPIVGCAPLALETVGPRADAKGMRALRLCGAVLTSAALTLTAAAAPAHAAVPTKWKNCTNVHRYYKHGVGRAKTRWVHLTRSPSDLAAMRAVRRALDPGGVLAPGVLLPEDTAVGDQP